MAIPADIEQVYRQLVGEQPATAAAFADEWTTLAGVLRDVARELRSADSTLAGWDSPAAKPAYESRSNQVTLHVERVAETTDSIGRELKDLAMVMRGGQILIKGLYADYQQTMAAWDGAEPSGPGGLIGGGSNLASARRQVEAGSTVGLSPAGGRDRQAFKALWDARAQRMGEEIAEGYYKSTGMLNWYATYLGGGGPLDAVLHPGPFGLADGLPEMLNNLAQPPAPPPPMGVGPLGGPGGGPGGAAPATTPPPPPGITLGSPAAAAAPGGSGAPDPLVTAPPAPPGASLTAPPAPPGPGGVGAPPVPPAIGAPLVPRAPGLAPAGPPTTAITRPPGFPGSPGGQPPLGRAAPAAPATFDPGRPGGPPGVPGVPGLSGPQPPGTTAPLYPGALDGPGAPPGDEVPGVPTRPPPGTLLPPGMEAIPPGMGMGMMPPGATAPPGNPPSAQRQGDVLGQPGPGTLAPPATPLAFAPPTTGVPPPVLGEPRKRPGPGSRVEAPRAASGGPGGGPPPVLVNRRHTGPRKTFTEQREAAGRTLRARRQAYQELLKSVFATGLPDGTAPVLEGRPAPANGAMYASALEVPAALRAARPAVPDQHAPPTPPADRATRRVAPDGPAADPEQATWDVETPGGPVVAGEQAPRSRAEPPPALGARG